MSREQVENVFVSLSASQGFYGRLLRDLADAEARGMDVDGWYEQFADCHDAVDVILRVEC